MSDGQTIIRYGDANSGVTIYRCLTRKIDQRAVMDSSGTSLKCWKFTISVTGYLHGWPGATVYMDSAFDNTPTSASDAHRHARWRMLPRQIFEMRVGCDANLGFASGKILLFAAPMSVVTSINDLSVYGLSNYDVDEGPRCLQFDVSHVSGDNIFKVDAMFEINVLQCADGDYNYGANRYDSTAINNKTGVLSHRWASADSIDANLRTGRTYHGMLELATSQFSPHWFRYLVVPPLQEGMRREHMEFVATEDGKKLQYTITDQSVAYAAPKPARKWAVEHTVGSINQDNIPMSTAQCSVALEGAEDCDENQLIILGMYILMAKLIGAKPGALPADNQPVMMNDITITTNVCDVKQVRISGSCRKLAKIFKDNPADNIGKGLAIDDNIGRVITKDDLPAVNVDYNPLWSAGGANGQPPELEGPARLAGIFRCYLQSACSGAGAIGTRTNLVGNNMPVQVAEAEPKQATSRTTVVPKITSSERTYSSSMNTAMYTTYQNESVFTTKQARAAMPIASAPASGTGVDTSPTVAIVGLTRPQVRRTLRIRAERVGAQPELPDPEQIEKYISATSSSSGYFPIKQWVLRSVLLAATESITCNGEKIYRAGIDILFALSRKPTADEALNIGKNAWSSGSGVVSTRDLTAGPNSIQG